ncbi:MAG: TonB family protein [Longimicrobiales bacterium]
MFSWPLYALVTGVLVAGAAAALDSVLRSRGRPTRSVWCVGLVVTLGLPLLAWLGVDSPAQIPVLPPLLVGDGDTASGPVLVLESLGATAFPWEAALVASWLGASALLAGRMALGAHRLHYAARGWRPSLIHGESVWLARLVGPAVVGWVRSRIVIPEWTLALEDRMQRLMLRHEREHVRARDPGLLFGARLVVLTMPWNPALWWQLHRLRLAVEADCDARVLAAEADVQRYGRLLLEVSRRRSDSPGFAAALTEPKSFLERRLELMLSTRSKPTARRTAGLLAVAGLLTSLAVCAEQPIVEPTPEQAELPGPAPDAGRADVAAAPTFTPFTVAPELANRTEVMDALQEAYPRLLRDAGIGGRAMVWFLIDETGRVEDVRIKEPTGHEALDAAALNVARTMEFSPALKDDERVTVWVALPIVFEVAQPGPERDEGRIGALLDADRPVVIIDGERLTGNAAKAALRDVSRERIARIEIVKGPAAVATYGADPEGGVILITTKPAGEPGSPDLLGRPATEATAAGGPTFTPFTKRPELANRSEVQDALQRHYPPLLKDAGIGGTTMVWFLIDETGEVVVTRVKESSGVAELDAAALAVARTMRFAPAENHGVPTRVWVALPIVFEVRRRP